MSRHHDHRTDAERVNEAIDDLHKAAQAIRSGYLPARAGARALLGSIGFPAGSGGAPGRSVGTHSDPTAGAALAGRVDGERLHDDLAYSIEQLQAACRNTLAMLERATDLGVTGEIPTVCAVCGRTPTGLDGDEELVNGVCIRHRCRKCGHVPTGKGNDRLRRGLCLDHYREERKAEQEAGS